MSENQKNTKTIHLKFIGGIRPPLVIRICEGTQPIHILQALKLSNHHYLSADLIYPFDNTDDIYSSVYENDVLICGRFL